MDGTSLAEPPDRTASMLLDSVPPAPFDPDLSVDIDRDLREPSEERTAYGGPRRAGVHPPDDDDDDGADDDDESAEATIQSRRPAAIRPGGGGEPLSSSRDLPSMPARARDSRPLGQTSELARDDFSAVLCSSAEPVKPPTDRPESRVGEVLGSYRLAEVIGRGGMGCVYRAEHVKLGRDVALKLLREDYAQRRDAVARFFQEARAVNLIRHRNIVDVIDYVEVDDSVFIIMELLSGPSLGKLMRQPGGLATQRKLGILAQICEGLSAAHAVGVVHRDLKPDNIIIARAEDGGDQVKILDFGVAKLIDRTDADPELTQVGAVIGTPAYMSPEQAGGLAVDARSDVYSLGAIMYELFTGQLPFRASSFGEYVRMHLTAVPAPPRSTPGGADLDPRIDGIIQRCLSKSPNARFESAEALRAEIAAVLGTMETLPMAGGPPGLRHAAEEAPGLAIPRGVGLAAHAASFAPPQRHTPTPQPAAAPVGPTASAAVRPGGEPGWPPPGVQGQAMHAPVPTPLPPHPLHGTPGPYGPVTPEPVQLHDLTGSRLERGPRREHLILVVAGIAAVAALAFAIPRLTAGGGSSGEEEAGVVQVPTRAAGGTAAGPAHSGDTTPDGTALAASAGAGAGEDSGGAAGPAGAGPSVPAGQARPAPDPSRASGTARTDPAPAAAPIRVRILSTPSGRVHLADQVDALCETPCSISIEQEAGQSGRRVYVVRRPGYQPETIAIDLADPPRQVRVALDREARPQTAERKPDRKPDRSDRNEKRPDRKNDRNDGNEKKPDRKKSGGTKPVGSDTTFNPFEDP